MAIKDNLFQFIKSLSQGEKKYFTLEADKVRGKKKEKNYWIIFQQIDKQKVYDKEALLKSLAKKGISAKQFSWFKTRLYDLILEKLRTYNRELNHGIMVSNLILDSDFLQEKKQLAKAQKVLQKAKAICVENHLDEHLLIVLKKMRQVYLRLEHSPLLEKLQEIHAQQYICLDRLVENMPYLALSDELLWLRRKGGIADFSVLTPSGVALVEAEAEPPLPDAFEGKYHYFFAKCQYHQLRGENKEAQYWHQKVMDLWERFAGMRKDYPDKLKLCILNHLSLCKENEDYSRFPEYWQLYQSIPSSSPAGKREDYLSLLTIQILYEMNVGSHLPDAFDLTSLKEKKRIETTLNAVRESRKLSIIFNLCFLDFMLERYDSSSAWLRHILILPIGDSRPDIQDFSKVFRIILLIDREKHTGKHELDGLERHIRNSQRYFKKDPDRHHHYLEWSTSLWKYYRASEEDKPGWLKLLREQVTPGMGEIGTLPLGHQELLWWLDARRG